MSLCFCLQFRFSLVALGAQLNWLDYYYNDMEVEIDINEICDKIGY